MKKFKLIAILLLFVTTITAQTDTTILTYNLKGGYVMEFTDSCVITIYDEYNELVTDCVYVQFKIQIIGNTVCLVSNKSSIVIYRPKQSIEIETNGIKKTYYLVGL